MTMRITNRMMSELALRRMNERLTDFERAQRDLATGRRIHAASDDVAGMNSALGLRASMSANVQAIRNAEDGLMWTELADTRLGSVVEQLQRVRELVIDAANGTTNGISLEAIAREVEEIRESAVGLANARRGGRPLFAGHLNVAAVANVGGTWTYQGDTGETRRRVGENEEVTVNVTAHEVFGFAAGEDLFTVLDTVAAQARAADRPGLQASLAAVDRVLDRVLVGRATLGAATNRIEQAVQRAHTDEVALRSQLSEVEDTDMAEAIMELQIQEVAYQAAQGALAKTLQPSLATFLR